MYVLAKCAEGFGYCLAQLSITMTPFVYLFDRYWQRRPDAVQLEIKR